MKKIHEKLDRILGILEGKPPIITLPVKSEEVIQKKGKLIETYDVLPYKWNNDEKPQETLIKPKMVEYRGKGGK
ncbi:MAG: hypothetical protein PHQ35_09480 [Phycisphaerae bacterium]|nr:hypothetical protein [Phycisphaerae bacterium]